MLGGVCWVPMAVRRKEKEMIYRAKEVIITRSDGSSVIMVVRNKTSRTCTLSPLILIRPSGSNSLTSALSGAKPYSAPGGSWVSRSDPPSPLASAKGRPPPL